MNRSFLPIFAVIVGLFLPCHRARALEAIAGGGLAYTHTVITSDLAGGVNSIYNGPGYLGDLRVRMSWLNSWAIVDFFGTFVREKTDNTNAAAKESNTHTGIGGGVDLHLGRLFVGAQDQFATSAITTSGVTTALAYNSFGLRAGYDMHLSSALTLSLGAVAETGYGDVKIKGINVSSTIREYSAFAVLQFRLFRSGEPSTQP